MTRVEVPVVVERGPVDKTFRRFQPDQVFLVPPSLDERLPQDHLARLIADVVDQHLDLSAFYAEHTQGRWAPPFDPRLMVRVLLLAHTTGVRSSRKLEQACWNQVAFRWLAGGEAPAYRAIAKFRKRHLSALARIHRPGSLSGFRNLRKSSTTVTRFWACRRSRLVRHSPVFRLVGEEWWMGSGRGGWWCCSRAELFLFVLPGPVGR